MAKKKKKYTSQKGWFENGHSILFKRYVFFDSLLNSSSASLQTLGKNAQTALTQQMRPTQKNMEQNNASQYMHDINYIQKYIEMLESLANAEFAQEQRYIQTLSKEGFPIEEFYDRQDVDYIGFIAALNKVQTDTKILEQTIEGNRANMKIIDDKMQNIQETSTAVNKYGQTQYEELTQSYKYYYSNYSHSMRDLVEKDLTDNVIQQINNKINAVIANMSKNTDFINQVIQALDDKGNILATLQNVAVEYIRQQLTANSFNISKLDTDITNIKDSNNLEIILKSAMEQQYNRAMGTLKSEMAQILEKSFRYMSGISDILLDTPSTLDEICDAMGLDKNDHTREELRTTLIQVQNKINGSEDKNSRFYNMSISSAKGILTKSLTKLIRSKQEITTPLKKKEGHALVKNIMTAYQQSIPSIADDASKALAKQLKITNLTASSTAEIVATPGFMNFVKDHISDIFTPGKEIQYKDDLTFNFSVDPFLASQIKFKKSASENILDVWATEQATSRGKLFLEKYQETAHGETSVEKAEQAYIQVLKEAQERRTQLLDATDKANQKIIEKYFKNKVDSSISVKEYRYYNNELGYHMGSMGGDGRVTTAVPNILKMLELGGITVPDADIIITAILNCFDDSVIGKDQSFLEDIKNLLIGGAAMMLFDDGFANAEAFLQRMANELEVKNASELPTGGSLHLLQLNGIYIPYSYVLTNIIEHLKRVYNDILTKNEPTKNLTGDKQRSTLEIYNSLSYATLKPIEEDITLSSSAEKWNAMAQVASDKVKIHFLFMSGMLDIMEDLEESFKYSR